jgi:acetyl esterase/lipase
MPAVPPETVLWPAGAPNALGSADADRPVLYVYRPNPRKANGAGIVVCPGGGYGGLAIDHEGHEVARWFASFGVTAAVLRYRHAPGYRNPVPLLDAQRAIRYLRSNATDLRLDAKRIGIMGFSAGGHLAATAATKWDYGSAAAVDPIEGVSSRPDFAILAYPVITMADPFSHRGSRENLLGPNAPQALIDGLSAERNVSAQTPPTFLFHTTNDDAVPVENSLLFYAALRKAGVPAEMHIYRAGPHGIGMNRDPADASWPGLAKDWLVNLGMLKRTKG